MVEKIKNTTAYTKAHPKVILHPKIPYANKKSWPRKNLETSPTTLLKEKKMTKKTKPNI